MKSVHLFLLFIVVAIAQLFVPAQMIFNLERTIEEGTSYKFKTQPIDPSDPFKGKYIRLNFEINSFATTDTIWNRNDEIYISLKNDSLGFAAVQRIDLEAPATGDYVKAKVDWYDFHEKTVNFTFPFDEFYMNEYKAYDAEIAHRKAQRDSDVNNTYALVYVKDGEAVLEDVFIDDIPIAEYVEKEE
ncbi:MAG: GDYXXLXY domain-containing protein [Aquaticitalea sp.]